MTFNWVGAHSQQQQALLVLHWGFSVGFYHSHLTTGDFYILSSCFTFMYSVVIGHRADGSRVLLTPPCGTNRNIGSPFRAVFLAFGGTNRIRTTIFQLVEPIDWHRFQVTNSRIFLFFSYQPATVVPSPRVAAVARPESPVQSHGSSSSRSDV